ncbi:MAG: alpha/beta fold hydrolase [Pseudomonadota bacterium]
MAELSVERLFSDPPLFGALPRSPKLTPDGEHVAYLRQADDDRERLDLWRLHIASARHEPWVTADRLGDGTTPDDATAEEKAERERRRQFAGGITAYRFSPDGRRLLLPVAGAAFVMDLAGGALERVTPAGTRQTDVRFSPDGRSVTYVRRGDLYRYDFENARETPLTADGGGPISNGLADFIAQEEMHRFEGYWWSPDSAWLAFTRVDESPIPETLRHEVSADAVMVVPQRYPYAGAENADVSLMVLHLESGVMREIPWRIEQDDYLARVAWLGGRLAVQRQSRDQRTLELYLFDPASGDGERLLEETAATWVNLHDNFYPLPSGQAGAAGAEFLWTSERSGHCHLYIYREGALEPLTEGHGRVNRVLWADRQRALVTGWFDTPTEQHLYEVALDGGRPPRALTHRPGWHEPVVAAAGDRVLDRMSSLRDCGRLELIALDADGGAAGGGDPQLLSHEVVDAAHPYFPYVDAHITPELGTLSAEDGQRLHYRLTRPAGTAPDGGFPAIVFVYGGPGVQRVRNEWPPLLLQVLAQRGYGVLELDNRGSGNRDREFEAPIHLRLGDVEVRDQTVGARFLQSQSWVNPQRIGVFGHSYGGYMTLMCLMRAPAIFKAGVAVAPVTDWRLYDTHYTERYLSTPLANPQGFEASSVLSHLDGLRGALLVVHGMADDNVLFTHTTRLIGALQSRMQAFEMMTYPGSKHGLQERSVSIHRFNMLLDFFGRHL